MTYFSNYPLEDRLKKIVGLIGFDGFSTADLTGPLEAFAAARDTNGEACYETILIGVMNPMFVSASGAMFKGEHTLATAPLLDTIIVPGGANLPGSETSKLLARWLRERGASARRIAAVSTGIYPLAEAGLLEGRHVTTHWRFAQHLASCFRALQVSDT
ncbi:MAG: DJ-1/PfpI family protein, partial [Verrucomicrobiaceae bacterium]|nr:DJ-1/PfpI family protein [Verrucomicrobiaceae bacterium]